MPPTSSAIRGSRRRRAVRREVHSERIVAVGDLYYIYQHEKHRRVPAPCRSCRSCSGRHGPALVGRGRVRPVPVRPPRGAALHAPRSARAPTGARSATGARRSPAGCARQHRLPPLFTHFVNQVTLFWRDKRISDVIRERAYDPSFGVDRGRPAGRARPAQQPEVHVLRPPQRAAGRGHAAARRGVPHPRRRRHQAAVRRRQRVGRDRGGAGALLQRAAGSLAAAADGRHRRARCCAGSRSRTSSQSDARAVRERCCWRSPSTPRSG